ncbi:MAG TPA: PLD nuclease N-terminal domain-containing protein [Ktedonosporobacter sp.]|nr:PLD nuclease N-terminal domain-containing protein [Ktedonosporobacter sp.]
MMIDPIWLLLRLLGIGGQGVLIIGVIFWAWTLIDCVTKEPSEGNDKIAWTLFVLFVPFLGSLVYYLIRRPERIKAVGR